MRIRKRYANDGTDRPVCLYAHFHTELDTAESIIYGTCPIVIDNITLWGIDDER